MCLPHARRTDDTDELVNLIFPQPGGHAHGKAVPSSAEAAVARYEHRLLLFRHFAAADALPSLEAQLRAESPPASLPASSPPSPSPPSPPLVLCAAEYSLEAGEGGDAGDVCRQGDGSGHWSPPRGCVLALKDGAVVPPYTYNTGTTDICTVLRAATIAPSSPPPLPPPLRPPPPPLPLPPPPPNSHPPTSGPLPPSPYTPAALGGSVFSEPSPLLPESPHATDQDDPGGAGVPDASTAAAAGSVGGQHAIRLAVGDWTARATAVELAYPHALALALPLVVLCCGVGAALLARGRQSRGRAARKPNRRRPTGGRRRGDGAVGFEPIQAGADVEHKAESRDGQPQCGCGGGGGSGGGGSDSGGDSGSDSGGDSGGDRSDGGGGGGRRRGWSRPRDGRWGGASRPTCGAVASDGSDRSGEGDGIEAGASSGDERSEVTEDEGKTRASDGALPVWVGWEVRGESGTDSRRRDGRTKIEVAAAAAAAAPAAAAAATRPGKKEGTLEQGMREASALPESRLEGGKRSLRKDQWRGKQACVATKAHAKAEVRGKGARRPGPRSPPPGQGCPGAYYGCDTLTLTPVPGVKADKGQHLTANTTKHVTID